MKSILPMHEVGIFLGKFDPFHLGHLSQIDYLSGICKELHIISTLKKDTFYPVDCKKLVEKFKNILLISINEQDLEIFLNTYKNFTFFYGDESNHLYKIARGCAGNQSFIKLAGHEDRIYQGKWEDLFFNKKKESTERMEDILKSLEEVKNKKILVIGDMIVDKYIYGTTDGISSEEPMIVFKPYKELTFQGGALAVYNNLKEFCQNVTIVYGSKSELIANSDKSIPVQKNYVETEKFRFKIGEKTVFKMTKTIDDQFTDDFYQGINSWLKDNIKTFDAIVVCDYGLGLINETIATTIVKSSQIHNIPLFVDAQHSSRIASLQKYKCADFFFQTLREIRSVTNKSMVLSELYIEARKILSAKRIYIKLGEQGLYTRNEFDEEVLFKSQSKNVIDISGAGDALLVGALIAFLASRSVEKIAEFGQIFAGIQISRLSNIPITLKDIKNYFL